MTVFFRSNTGNLWLIRGQQKDNNLSQWILLNIIASKYRVNIFSGNAIDENNNDPEG